MGLSPIVLLLTLHNTMVCGEETETLLDLHSHMVPTKKVEKTPYEIRASGSLEDLEIIQEDTHPSLDTSLNHEEDDQER
ncbi:hypothetical protein Tco_1310433 [Tanacetum coccineum]